MRRGPWFSSCSHTRTFPTNTRNPGRGWVKGLCHKIVHLCIFFECVAYSWPLIRWLKYMIGTVVTHDFSWLENHTMKILNTHKHNCTVNNSFLTGFVKTIILFSIHVQLCYFVIVVPTFNYSQNLKRKCLCLRCRWQKKNCFSTEHFSYLNSEKGLFLLNQCKTYYKKS